MQVVGYSRVSTSEQASEGVRLEIQAKKIAAYCLVKDWQLSEVISDTGESGKSFNRLVVSQFEFSA